MLPDTPRSDAEIAEAAKRSANLLDGNHGGHPSRLHATLQPRNGGEPPALARCARILDEFAADIRRHGLAGEKGTAELIYLSVVSRLLTRPTSVVVKGPSSAGKSFVVKSVLQFFPKSAYHDLTAMSPKALAYGDESLSHRMLVIYEAAALQDEMGSYLLRSLLSEGRIRYETVDASKGPKPVLVEREGPTGLILTTTSPLLHPENETRLLSVTVSDTAQQTRAVLLALAADDMAESDVDMERWHVLQEWLWNGERHVSIPFGTTLATELPPVAVRLRRDFGQLLNLIRAHALLHRASRARDELGRIVATVDDYGVVRGLISSLVAESVQAGVPETVRETVEAVRELAVDHEEGVTVTALANRLELDKSAALRRARTAIAGNYLVNLEDRRGRPARLVVGEALPDQTNLLPEPDVVAGLHATRGGAPESVITEDEDSSEGAA